MCLLCSYHVLNCTPATATTDQLVVGIGERVDDVVILAEWKHSKLIPFLTNLKCKYFHFSSTPHKTDFDEAWGHINIKSEDEWIALFEQCGFKLDRKMSLPTSWSLLFAK